MRKAEVFFHGEKAGMLEELEKNRKYRFTYDTGCSGWQISMTMPADRKVWEYS